MKYIPSVIVLVLLFVGCNRRPAELPPTFPCKIIIVNDGVPQSDCDISLRSETSNRLLSIMGRTDSSGVAEIRTQCAGYTANGAPLGTFKVVVDKQVALPGDDAVSNSPMPTDVSGTSPTALAARMAKRAAELEKLRGFSSLLCKEDTTPLEITLVKGGQSQWTFDLKEHRP